MNMHPAERLSGSGKRPDWRRIEAFFFFLVEAALCVFAVYFMVKRIPHGINFDDEAWYVADPYLVARGRIPYVNDWTMAPGFTIPLALCFRIYAAWMGTEGIMLFSRQLYLVWILSVGALTLWIIRKELDSRFPVIAWLPVLLMLYFLFYINYNSIGVVYLPLLLTLLYAAWDKPDREAFRRGLAAGVLGGRAVIGSPFLMAPAFAVLLLLFLMRKKSLRRGVLLGVGLTALLVIGWCCLRGGAERLIYGLFVNVSDLGYFQKGAAKVEKSSTLFMLWRYSIIPLQFVALAVALRLLLRRREKLLRIALTVLALVFMIYGLRTGWRWQRLMILNCWFEFLILPLFPGEGKKRLALYGIALLYVLLFVISSLGNIYGVEGREYWLIVPCILSCLTFMIVIPNRFVGRSVFTALIACFFLIQCRYSWNQIYRDAPVSEHTATISSGIWKGCKTTEDRARDVVALEACIRQITAPGDKVLFRDWVSYGYLMSNGEACTPSVLTNGPKILYDLFYTDQTVPDKILYVAPHAEELTIETEGHPFNSFVNDYYELTFTCENPTFRLREYDLRDGEAALADASAKASRLPWQS